MSVNQLKVVLSQLVLVDACGWAAVIDSGMNIDTEMNRVFGPAQLRLLDSVKQEIERLNQERTRKKNLLLPLLEQKSEFIEPLSTTSEHPDDQLFELASELKVPVLTVDVDLKRRLYEADLPILEVSKNQRLQLVDSL
jgi:rRNA-processing protein FCF1